MLRNVLTNYTIAKKITFLHTLRGELAKCRSKGQISSLCCFLSILRVILASLLLSYLGITLVVMPANLRLSGLKKIRANNQSFIFQCLPKMKQLLLSTSYPQRVGI